LLSIYLISFSILSLSPNRFTYFLYFLDSFVQSPAWFDSYESVPEEDS